MTSKVHLSTTLDKKKVSIEFKCPRTTARLVTFQVCKLMTDNILKACLTHLTIKAFLNLKTLLFFLNNFIQIFNKINMIALILKLRTDSKY